MQDAFIVRKCVYENVRMCVHVIKRVIVSACDYVCGSVNMSFICVYV